MNAAVSPGLWTIERTALWRIRERAAAVSLGLVSAEVGALALLTACARFGAALRTGTLEQVGVAIAAVGLGTDLALLLGSLGLGLAVVAVIQPLRGRALFLPAARASAGIVLIQMVCFFVSYAAALGLLQLAPALLARTEGPVAGAAVLALAVTPIAVVLSLLQAGGLAAAALVARGLAPGLALATGLDAVLRRPGRALSLLAIHALLGAALVGGALWAAGTVRVATLILPPMVALSLLLAVTAFDAVLDPDPSP